MGAQDWRRAAQRLTRTSAEPAMRRRSDQTNDQTLLEFIRTDAGRMAQRLLRAADKGVVLAIRRQKGGFETIFLDGTGVWRIARHIGDTIVDDRSGSASTALKMTHKEINERFAPISRTTGRWTGSIRTMSDLVRHVCETLDEIAKGVPASPI